MRRTGPNRHLSDLSDASTVPPRRVPFPTQGPKVAACDTVFYSSESALMDSAD